MKIAFIVMAYKDPLQIDRLVKSMNHKAFDFFIHVDKKFDIEPFLFLKENKNVFFFEKRYTVYWAAWRFTKALILSIKYILQLETKYDFIASISGQDYPIKSNQYLVDFYQNNIGKSFFSLEGLDSSWWEHAHSRTKRYHMTNFDFPGRYKIQRILNLILPERNFVGFDQLFGGPRATWWTMSADCASYVANFVLENRKLQLFYTFTWCPDEFLIPSIVMNSEFKDNVINDSGRYIDWSQGGSNPKILTIDDFDRITSSGKLFARKFDFKVDTKILDLIDFSRQNG